MIPLHLATVKMGSSVTWTASCFSSMKGTLTLSPDGKSANFLLEARNPAKLDCNDWYVFANSYQNYWLDVAVLNNNRNVTLKNFKPDELRDLQQNGLAVLVMPCGILGTIESIVNTASLFIGPDLDGSNRKFLLERGVWSSFDTFGKVQPIDKALIKSGDSIQVTRLDGLDPLIMFGTGGRTGHVVVAVWEGSTLYICESTDANPFGEQYWPPPYGIIRTEYSKWIELATKAQYVAALLPLAPEFQQKFNETKYWRWFREVQGMPYGYHSMLYSFLDTFPMRNLPQPIDEAMLNWFVTTMDRLLPNSTEGVSIYALFTEGLNQRLGGFCGDMACISKKVNDLKTNLGVITAIPEQDSWRFDGGNFSMVCSIFVARAWIEGMNSGWTEITGGEQTPKDNYQMKVYDTNRFNSLNCPIGLMSDPTGNGNYCQLMGKYKLPLNGYNTVPLYSRMNEKCPAQWPDYFRCPKETPQCC